MKTYTATEIKELIKDIPDDKWCSTFLYNNGKCCLAGHVELLSGNVAEYLLNDYHCVNFLSNIKNIIENFFRNEYKRALDFYVVNDNSDRIGMLSKKFPEFKAIHSEQGIKQRNLLFLDLMIQKGY